MNEVLLQAKGRDRNVEVSDDNLGFVAGMELSAQKARILLMLGLTKTSEVKKLQQYFNVC